MLTYAVFNMDDEDLSLSDNEHASLDFTEPFQWRKNGWHCSSISSSRDACQVPISPELGESGQGTHYLASEEAARVAKKKQRGKVLKGHKDITEDTTTTKNVGGPKGCAKRVSRRRVARGYEVRRKKLWATNKCHTYARLDRSKLL